LLKAGRVPRSLFAHNTQVRETQAVHALENNQDGVLGRLMDALAAQPQPYTSGAYSVAGIAKILEGDSVSQNILDRQTGVVRFENRDALASALANMTALKSEAVFAEHYAHILGDALSSTEALGDVLDNVSLTAPFAGHSLAQQLEQVARVVKARGQIGEERQTFFVSLGGFDTHASEHETVTEKFGEVNEALSSFVQEMKAEGVWDQVAVLTASDFGRTIGSNGAGTDHAWGGHYLAMGGSINGGRMFGRFPESLDPTSAVNIGRNHRILPTTPWEGIWSGLAEWFGATAAQISDIVLPNAKHFPAADLLTASQLMRGGS